MAINRTFDREQIELDPLAYGPKIVRHDLRDMEVWSPEFALGYNPTVGTGAFTLYGSTDGYTKGRTLGTIAANAMPYKFPPIDVTGENWGIIERTTAGTSGVIWVGGTAKAGA